MLMGHNLVGQQFSGLNPIPQGSLYPSFGDLGGSFSPYGAFGTADGWLMVGVSNDRIFARLCAAVGHKEWALDARFSTNVLRVTNRAELNALLNQIFRQKPTSHWKLVCDDHDVPVAPIQNSGEVLTDPQIAALQQLDPLCSCLDTKTGHSPFLELRCISLDYSSGNAGKPADSRSAHGRHFGGGRLCAAAGN